MPAYVRSERTAEESLSEVDNRSCKRSYTGTFEGHLGSSQGLRAAESPARFWCMSQGQFEPSAAASNQTFRLSVIEFGSDGLARKPYLE